ncbi:hypothetical protein D9M71_593840 [compost metagenome]
MHYLQWKRCWFASTFVNTDRDWLYFPDKDEIHSFQVNNGVEVQDSDDYWREFSKNAYLQYNKPLTADQKLDKILTLLESTQ